MRTLRTVTMNTGYDDYYSVSGLSWGGRGTQHRFESVCSGKGISCARTATALAIPHVAYGLIGEHDHDDFSRRLADEHIEHRLFRVPGTARHNLTLVDATGEKVAAHFMAAGYSFDSPLVVAPMVETVLAETRPGDIVTLNGSTSKGLASETWAALAAGLIERGADVIVDAQNEALMDALEVRGVLAFKPNDDEIMAIPAVAEAYDHVGAALDLFRSAGARIPLVSLGADGVQYLDEAGQRIHATCRVEAPIQSVMAGDAFVAGFVWGVMSSQDQQEWVRHGLAAAAAHVAGLTGDGLLARAKANLSEVRFEPVG